MYFASSSDGSHRDKITNTDAASRAWYEQEEYLYPYDGTFTSGTGHFTQMVWKGSCGLGCGQAGNYVVCRYSPQGNFLGRFEENVMPRMDPVGTLGLAQTGAKAQLKPVAVDPHLAKLEKMLEASKEEFAAMVQQARGDLAEVVATERAEAAEYAEQAKQAYAAEALAAREGLDAMIDDCIGQLDAATADRKAELQDLADSRLGAFEMVMEAKISKVQGWILERLEWVEKMPHSYLQEHLTKELKAAKEAHTEAIQQRIDTARADAAEARESLCDALDGRASEIEDFAADAS